MLSGDPLRTLYQRWNVIPKHCAIRLGATPCALEYPLEEQKSFGYEGGFLHAVGSVGVLVLAHSCRSKEVAVLEKASTVLVGGDDNEISPSRSAATWGR